MCIDILCTNKVKTAIRAKDDDSSRTAFQYEFLSQQKTEHVWSLWLKPSVRCGNEYNKSDISANPECQQLLMEQFSESIMDRCALTWRFEDKSYKKVTNMCLSHKFSRWVVILCVCGAFFLLLLLLLLLLLQLAGYFVTTHGGDFGHAHAYSSLQNILFFHMILAKLRAFSFPPLRFSLPVGGNTDQVMTFHWQILFGVGCLLILYVDPDNDGNSFFVCWICLKRHQKRDPKKPLLCQAPWQLSYWSPLIGPTVCGPHKGVGNWLPYIFDWGFVPHAADLCIHNLFTHVIHLLIFTFPENRWYHFPHSEKQQLDLLRNKGGTTRDVINFIVFSKPPSSFGLSWRAWSPPKYHFTTTTTTTINQFVELFNIEWKQAVYEILLAVCIGSIFCSKNEGKNSIMNNFRYIHSME